MIANGTKIMQNASRLKVPLFVCFATFVGFAGSASGATCESIATLSLSNAKITTSQQVAPGTFIPPGLAGATPPVYAKLPAFCRVTATLQPSADSDIKIEVWLPVSGWNGKFQAVGNGGWNGNIPYGALANAVIAGYAAAGTDTGHVGNTAAFALGHPEKLIDFGYRAVHEMTVKAKSIVDSFYGSMPTLSLFNGCSQGGRQGVTAAVRYPADFDGIVVGAPAVNFVHLHAGRVALNRSMNLTPASAIPAAKYPLIHQAVLAACDAQDGVADGVLENPGACSFDPKVLQCSAHENATCLSAAQVESAKSMYAGAKHPSTKQLVVPGLAPGAELGWNVLGSTQPLGLAVDTYKYVFMKDSKWEASRFNAATDLDVALASDPDDALGSTNADLRPFFARGGKLLMYHGWSDPQVTPYNTINFFHKVLATQGGAGAGTSIQLYMVPGMNHCQGGPGTDVFEKVGALEEWIKTGSAPARIEAAHYTNGVVDRARPLCPLGQVARWSGAGSTDDAANFACVASTVGGTR
jgi:feruloyl esterase